MTTALDPDLHAELRRLHVPAVVVDPAGVPDLDVPTIGATTWAGGVSATEHLTRLGHRGIGFIAGRPGLWCSRARLDGYRAGLKAVGVTVDPDLVVQGDFDDASGYEGARRPLALPDRQTAVFAASDEMAMGVYEAARQRGLRVPEDLSVVGFDDLLQASWTSPPLTTVRQPLPRWGCWPCGPSCACSTATPREREGRAGDGGRRPPQHGTARRRAPVRLTSCAGAVMHVRHAR